MGLVVGIVVGAFALFVGVRRLAQARGLFPRNEQDVRGEQMLREALEIANGPNRWRQAGDTDANAVALLNIAESDERALGQLGFRVLGDLVAEHPAHVAVMRAFARGSTLAAIAVSMAAPSRVRLAISSYKADEVFRTIRGFEPWFARPPFKHVQHLRADESPGMVVRDHEEFAKAEGLRTFATLDDVLATIAKEHDDEQRWRAAQPPEELLQADLRGLLGEHYRTSGAYWSRKLRGKLPGATLRRG